MVFFDNASTTKVYPEVNEMLLYYNNIEYYNAGGLYKSATEISNKISFARHNILKMLGGKIGDNFVFTSGATEANNMVINFAKKFKKGKFLFSVGEHPSVYNTALEMRNQGFNVDFVKLDSSGKVDILDYESKLTSDVVFVSIMHVSNETGAINPIKKLCEIAKKVNNNIIFHSDGVQAVGKISVNLSQLGVDLYTISAHKIHGPKGVGGLYIKSGISIKPFIFGGGQENGLRSGTENVGGILAFDRALQISISHLDESYDKITLLKKQLLSNFENFDYKPKIVSSEDSSPYVVSFLYQNLRGETLLHKLDDCGFMVGNGSACSSKRKGNRILENMGYSDSEIEGALRVSFSFDNTIEEVDNFTRALNAVIIDYKKGTGR